MYTIDDGLKWLNLQIEPEQPVLSSVDCTYSSPFCEKPLLTKKENAPVFSEVGNQNILHQAGRAKNKQQFHQKYAYFDTDSKSYWAAFENSRALWPQIGFSIKFDKPVLITGVWWSASFSNNDYGYLFKIRNVEFEMNGKKYEGDFLNEDHERKYDAGKDDIGKKIVRLNQPAYTDEISFTKLYYKKENNHYKNNDRIAFTFEVYGCDEFEMDAILCPEGWYSSKGYCIKAIGES